MIKSTRRETRFVLLLSVLALAEIDQIDIDQKPEMIVADKLRNIVLSTTPSKGSYDKSGRMKENDVKRQVQKLIKSYVPHSFHFRSLADTQRGTQGHCRYSIVGRTASPTIHEPAIILQ